jgi:PIN domain nuclease of toxin-antitoxin system
MGLKGRGRPPAPDSTGPAATHLDQVDQRRGHAIATADLVWVSAASGWEVAIKQGLGKLRLADPFRAMVTSSEFEELPVTLRHSEQPATLAPRHTDPFDRMLVAQAQVEGVWT